MESYPLFGADLNDYEELYEEKIALLLALNEAGRKEESITWSGKFRPALEDATIYPRPVNNNLDIWIATGGTPAQQHGPQRWEPTSFTRCWAEPSATSPGTRSSSAQEPRKPDTIPRHSRWGQRRRTGWQRECPGDFLPVLAPSHGRHCTRARFHPAQPHQLQHADRTGRRHLRWHPGTGRREDPAHASSHMGHDRHILEMDFASVPQKDVLKSIELFGTEVKPLIDAELPTTKKVNA
ncbi:hypothetical protein NHF46_23895 [Arthrobacter alpinus]|nr:hypothetical protein [Arthrobacter alpinus]